MLSCFCAVGLLTSACSRTAERQRHAPVLTYEISPQPARVGPVLITFKLAEPDAKPISGVRVNVEADMTHAGMSPVFAEAKEIEAGRYQASLHFDMAGDWIVLLHIVLLDGQKLERQVDVRGVRPN